MSSVAVMRSMSSTDARWMRPSVSFQVSVPDRVDVLGQHLAVAHDHVERRAQLVRHGGDEVRLEPARGLQTRRSGGAFSSATAMACAMPSVRRRCFSVKRPARRRRSRSRACRRCDRRARSARRGPTPSRPGAAALGGTQVLALGARDLDQRRPAGSSAAAAGCPAGTRAAHSSASRTAGRRADVGGEPYTPRLSSKRNVLLQSQPSRLAGEPVHLLEHVGRAQVDRHRLGRLRAASPRSRPLRRAGSIGGRPRSDSGRGRTHRALTRRRRRRRRSTTAPTRRPARRATGRARIPPSASPAPVACATGPHGSRTARPFTSAPTVIAARSGGAPTTTW